MNVFLQPVIIIIIKTKEKHKKKKKEHTGNCTKRSPINKIIIYVYIFFIYRPIPPKKLLKDEKIDVGRGLEGLLLLTTESGMLPGSAGTRSANVFVFMTAF